MLNPLGKLGLLFSNTTVMVAGQLKESGGLKVCRGLSSLMSSAQVPFLESTIFSYLLISKLFFSILIQRKHEHWGGMLIVHYGSLNVHLPSLFVLVVESNT